MRYDLVVRSRRTVLPEGTRAAAVAVSGPSIAAIASYGERLDAARAVDLGDLPLLPGLVDTHVHVNEPGLPAKGRIAVGCDADLAAFDPEESFVVDPARLEHRHPVTPYAGRTLTGRVRQAWLRGSSLLDAGSEAPGGEPVGRLLNRG
jgi:dihydroorotase-like cyclic amidohydrolase